MPLSRCRRFPITGRRISALLAAGRPCGRADCQRTLQYMLQIRAKEKGLALLGVFPLSQVLYAVHAAKSQQKNKIYFFYFILAS